MPWRPAPLLPAASVTADACTRTQHRGRRDLRRQREEYDAYAATLALNMQNPRFWSTRGSWKSEGFFFAVMVEGGGDLHG